MNGNVQLGPSCAYTMVSVCNLCNGKETFVAIRRQEVFSPRNVSIKNAVHSARQIQSIHKFLKMYFNKIANYPCQYTFGVMAIIFCLCEKINRCTYSNLGGGIGKHK